ncbi:hypothetical protein JCM10450v2_001862 [Rhodotorula kratochvilovae]
MLLLLPHKTLLALCVLAILAAHSTLASSLPSSLESRSLTLRQRRAPAPLPNPKAAAAAAERASHLSRPSRYFPAPLVPPAAAAAKDDATTPSRQKGVSYRAAKLRAAAVGASADRLRRKRAAISAAAHVASSSTGAAAAGAHARRAVRWARVAAPEELSARGRGGDDAREGRARAHLAKRGRGAELEVSPARRMEIRMKRMVPLFKEEQ